jgi:1,4-alpha-glucan branching enzyme
MNGKRTVEITLSAPQAKAVAIAGTFNNWDPSKTPMRRVRNGDWSARVTLPPGRHEYRFVVDGQWLSDPGARESVPNPYGATNSVLAV